MDSKLPVSIERPPDYLTCGPTSLHALYRYYNDPIEREKLIKEKAKLPGPGGGTLMVHLAVHALDNLAYGTKYYRANIYLMLGAIFFSAWAATTATSC